MKKITYVKMMLIGVFALAMMACGGKNETAESSCCNESNNKTEMKYSKKYTNADFYTNGEFNQEVAIAAFKDMLKFYDLPWTSFMDAEFWAVDFGLGDFENVGMGGIFWVNDQEHGYFAHTIYLLPGQMIPEHAHVKTEFAPKFETWMVTKGWVYNFSEIGEASASLPAIPASHGPIKSINAVKQEIGDIIHLKKEESFHFLIAGPEGAVVDEWASYHDGAGLRFTNPKAKL